MPLLALLSLICHIVRPVIFVFLFNWCGNQFCHCKCVGNSGKMKNNLKKRKNYKRVTNLFLIPVTAITGDAIIQYMYPYISLLVKCLTDSATHFLIASLSWTYIENVSLNKRIHLVPIIICGSIASVIDIDHFVAVGTTSLQVNIHTNSGLSYFNLSEW